MSKARVSARIKLETSMPDVKFKPNSDASDGEETEDEVSDDIIGQPLANFDTPLEVCNTLWFGAEKQTIEVRSRPFEDHSVD